MMPGKETYVPERHGSDRITVLVVEEEESVLQDLTHLLSLESDLDVVGRSSSRREAAQLVVSLRPQIVFLDIHLCGPGGLEIFEGLPVDEIPVAVFVCACDIYAVQALAINKLPFVLKPFLHERMENALGHARALLEQRALDRAAWSMRYANRIQAAQHMLREFKVLEPTTRPTSYLDRFAVKQGPRIRFVPTEEVNYIEAEGDYVILHGNGRKHLIRARIHDLEEKLDPRTFVRIHRSLIVRVDRIKELCGAFHGDYRIILHDQTELPLSRHFKDRLFRLLGHPV